MRSQTPKVLHLVAGKPLLAHVLDAVRCAGARPVGDVARVVEVRLATSDERRLPESNLGAYAVDLAWLHAAVPRLRANETGEIFLTDLVALASAEGARVAAYCTEDADEGMGVNT